MMEENGNSIKIPTLGGSSNTKERKNNKWIFQTRNNYIIDK